MRRGIFEAIADLGKKRLLRQGILSQSRRPRLSVIQRILIISFVGEGSVRIRQRTQRIVVLGVLSHGGVVHFDVRLGLRRKKPVDGERVAGGRGVARRLLFEMMILKHDLVFGQGEMGMAPVDHRREIVVLKAVLLVLLVVVAPVLLVVSVLRAGEAELPAGLQHPQRVRLHFGMEPQDGGRQTVVQPARGLVPVLVPVVGGLVVVMHPLLVVVGSLLPVRAPVVRRRFVGLSDGLFFFVFEPFLPA